MRSSAASGRLGGGLFSGDCGLFGDARTLGLHLFGAQFEGLRFDGLANDAGTDALGADADGFASAGG